MPQMHTYQVTVRDENGVDSTVGARMDLSASTDSGGSGGGSGGADSGTVPGSMKDFVNAKVALMIGKPIYEVGSTRSNDSLPSSKAETGSSSRAVFLMEDDAGRRKSITLPNVSHTFGLATKTGEIDVSNAAVTALASKYGTFMGGTWIVISAHFKD